MYKLAVREGLDRKLKKLAKKDRAMLVLIHKKVHKYWITLIDSNP